MTEKELIVMNKLEYLKEIRYRMQEIDRMRSSINEELDLVNVEEKCLQEYRREMDSLYQEKMTHVEELRQIHSDINMLENVLKQSEEDRNRHVDNVKRLHHHLQQMKDGVEKMRSEIGLPRMQENLTNQNNQKDEDALMLDKLDLVLDAAAKRHGNNNSSGYLKGEFELKATTMDPLVAKQLSSSSSNNPSTNVGSGSTGSTNKPFADNTNTSATNSSGPKSSGAGGGYSSSLASLMSGFQDLHTGGSRTSGQSMAQSLGSYNDHHHGTSSASASASSVVPNSVASAAAAAAFRQQPPPMKSCLSCHQQIHRNAPICPLCKAKSRSRHPKRRNQPKQN